MKIYNKLLETIILPVGDYLTGANFIKELKNWRRISSLSERELEELSKKNLKTMLDFTITNIPFYKKYAEVKCDDPYLWIKQFPIMYKKDIRENIDHLTSCPKEDLIKAVSSGSSGIQGTVYMNKKARNTSRAIQFLWWEWSGFYAGKPILQTGMTPKRGFIKSVKDILFRTKYIIAFGLSQEQVAPILNRQKGKSNYHIGGYASSLFVLADECEKLGIKDVKFDGAISWGDKMFPHYRKKIQEVFGCNVTDTYGCTEGTMIACQKDSDFYYIMSPHIFLELLDREGNEVSDGELGYVVLTRLDNFAMPLMRYYNGDMAIKLPRERYPKHRDMGFPLLERIIGRDTDIVRTESGKYMIVHFFTGIFEHYQQIKQFRVIQRELFYIEIEYITEKDFTKDTLSAIEKTIQNYLNEPFKIIWHEVENIPATASGKPQIIQTFIA